MKIGYQGIKGSNSEIATKEFIKRLGINPKDVMLFPLATSENVVSNLKQHRIDAAVLAFSNSVTGVVVETEEAMENLKNSKVEVLDTLDLALNHCVFIKPNVDFKDVNMVATHIQALKQTKEWREENMKDFKVKEVEDTALAARMLAFNQLPDNCAVICRKEAGNFYKLKLAFEALNPDNKTVFKIFKI